MRWTYILSSSSMGRGINVRGVEGVLGVVGVGGIMGIGGVEEEVGVEGKEELAGGVLGGIEAVVVLGGTERVGGMERGVSGREEGVGIEGVGSWIGGKSRNRSRKGYFLLPNSPNLAFGEGSVDTNRKYQLRIESKNFYIFPPSLSPSFRSLLSSLPLP
jgi:hypothetical protein